MPNESKLHSLFSLTKNKVFRLHHPRRRAIVNTQAVPPLSVQPLAPGYHPPSATVTTSQTLPTHTSTSTTFPFIDTSAPSFHGLQDIESEGHDNVNSDVSNTHYSWELGFSGFV